MHCVDYDFSISLDRHVLGILCILLSSVGNPLDTLNDGTRRWFGKVHKSKPLLSSDASESTGCDRIDLYICRKSQGGLNSSSSDVNSEIRSEVGNTHCCKIRRSKVTSSCSASNAEIARSMYRCCSWIVPRLNATSFCRLSKAGIASWMRYWCSWSARPCWSVTCW